MTEVPEPFRILNIEPDTYSDAAREILCSLGEVDEGVRDREELLERIGHYDAVIVRLKFRIDDENLEAARRLKAIVSATTGLDHIDLDAAEKRGVEVLSLRGETEFLRSIPATAEHTWAILLALVRHIPAAADSVLSGRWDRDAFRGSELQGKRLGVLGVGRIGERVARYGAAFDMPVVGYDPAPKRRVSIVQYCGSLGALLELSEILSIHVPLTEQTTNLVGSDELALLPERAILVNTSRGDVLDEAALLDALSSERLAGAALDVVAGESKHGGPRSELVRYAAEHENLLLTPHIGGATLESIAKTDLFMARKLQRWLLARSRQRAP